MFTGLIEEIGQIVSVNRHEHLVDITIEAHTVFDDLSIGDSITINGACLSVTSIGDNAFTVQAVDETINRTTLGNLKRGSSVNLERALRVGDRLGGHLVQGHVDSTGRVTSVRKTGNNLLISIAADPGFERYIVEKGSITIDGISLTVTYVRGGEFGVSIIPHTTAVTTLQHARIGDRVNLETDILAKYVEKLLHTGGGLTINHLEKLGF